MGAVDDTFLAHLIRKLVRMFVLIKSKRTSNLGYLESKTRSRGQIKEIPCEGCRGHMSCSIDLKIGQNVFLNEILDEFEVG